MTDPEQVPENFVPLSLLVDAFMAQAQEEFMKNHPDAVLLVDNPGEDVENASFQTIAKGGKGGDTTGTNQEKLLNRLGTARWVAKLERKKNKFASMITMGRAATNDVRFNVPSVSKFHAYFTHVARDSCWYLADANSSNGTFINGEELPPSHGKVKLENGSVLRFGPDVTAQFYDARGMWDMLNSRLEQTQDGAGGEDAPDPADQEPSDETRKGKAEQPTEDVTRRVTVDELEKSED